jgi:hypothetical protein
MRAKPRDLVVDEQPAASQDGPQAARSV